MANMNIGAGGGGSGYIGNTNTTNKYMVGYKVEASTDEGTLTRSTNNHSQKPISDWAKQKNGFVRITYIGPTETPAPTGNYIFKPDFSSDGRDVANYDATNMIDINASGTQVSNIAEGTYIDPLQASTINNGEIYCASGQDEFTAFWGIDSTKSQGRIAPGSTITVSADIKRTDIYDGETTPSIRLILFREEDDSTIEYYEIDFMYYGDQEFYFIDRSESSNELNWSWGQELSANEDMIQNEWYNFKFVISLTDNYVSSATFYFNETEVGTKTLGQEDDHVPFPMVSGENTVTLAGVALQCDSDVFHIKNVYVEYEASI